MWEAGSQGESAMTLKLFRAPPPPTPQFRWQEGEGGERRGRCCGVVGKAAGPQLSWPAPHTPAVSTGESGRQRPPLPPAAGPPPSPASAGGEEGPPFWPGAGEPPSAPSAHSVLGTACFKQMVGTEWRGMGVPTRPSRLRLGRSAPTSCKG